jgi:hypothetical protein
MTETTGAKPVPCRIKREPTLLAMHWDGAVVQHRAIIGWIEANGWTAGYHDGPSAISIGEPGENRTVVPGDWVVRGITGYFFACSEDEFAAVYAPIPDTPDDAGPDGETPGYWHVRQALTTALHALQLVKLGADDGLAAMARETLAKVDEIMQGEPDDEEAREEAEFLADAASLDTDFRESR